MEYWSTVCNTVRFYLTIYDTNKSETRESSGQGLLKTNVILEIAVFNAKEWRLVAEWDSHGRVLWVVFLRRTGVIAVFVHASELWRFIVVRCVVLDTLESVWK